jgi:hypothetical protein
VKTVNLTKRQLRRIIREATADESTETSLPSKYDDVNWSEYLSDGDSAKTLKNQMMALAALSQQKFPGSEFFPPGSKQGQFTITPESLSKEEASGDQAGTAFKDAYEASLERNKGLRAEDGLAAFYTAHGVKVAGIEGKSGDQARQAGGEDLRIGNQIAELKTAGGSDLNLALNSTAPHDDPGRWYIFLTNRDKLPATVYVINSQILFYRNFAKLAGVGSGGKIDASKLETAIKTTLSKELGGVQLEDIITKAAMGKGREEGVVLSFSLGGLSVRLRLMFTLKSKIADAPVEDIADLQAQDVQVELLSGGTQGSEENPIDPDWPIVAASFSRKIGSLISESVPSIINSHLTEVKKKYLKEYSLRMVVREVLLAEELTKSDKKEIEKIARKQIAKDMLAKKEIQKIARQQAEDEIKRALGVSFGGIKGDINKFVSDTTKDQAQKWLNDKEAHQQVADITKKVMKKLYKDLAFSYPQVIDRIKV